MTSSVAGDAKTQDREQPSHDEGMMRAMALAELVRSKHAVATTLLDLRGLSHVADYFVICHGTSGRQVKAIADAVQQWTEKPFVVEGYEGLRWVLVDFVDVVVHTFDAQAREFYAIERLWGDAPVQVFPDDDEPARAESAARHSER
jgi:ribosome-associated protein